MENLVKALVAVKVLGAALVLLALGIFAILMVSTDPDAPESGQGYTAVCKDGVVLEPPGNQCGERHGYLDHWTTGPAPAEEPIQPLQTSVAPLPDTAEDDWLTAYPSGCTNETPLASPWDPCASGP